MSKRLGVIIAILLSLSAATETASSSDTLLVEEQQQTNNDDAIFSAEEEEHKTVQSATADTDSNQSQHQQDVQGTTSTTIHQSSKTPAAAAHEPPSHFHISAHIQTNLHTGLSYFLPRDTTLQYYEKSYAHLPFLECGAIGSTTATVPLVSGAFRHVPMMSGVDYEMEKKRKGSALEFLEESGIGVSFTSLSGSSSSGEQEDGGSVADGGGNDDENVFFVDDDEDAGGSSHDDKNKEDNWPKRPSPPTYVVALSPLEITVGGNGSETQQFDAGDVIFFEDTWLGIWDEMDSENNNDDLIDGFKDKEEKKVKGYTMRALPESRKDMNVIMLTIPPALHRQWKHRHQRQQQQEQMLQAEMVSNDNNLLNKSQKRTASPWWKLSSRIIKKQQTEELPQPCSLESDPAFAHPSVSVPTTLSNHFSQHFTNLLRQFQRPFHLSSSSHSDYDLILPILAQTFAALIGGATAFAGVLHLLRTVNPTVAIGFGAACVIGFGTWGIVWLGEELLDEWEMWRERRRLERRMSESWA